MYINVLQKHTVVRKKKVSHAFVMYCIASGSFFQAFLFSVLLPLLIKTVAISMHSLFVFTLLIIQVILSVLLVQLPVHIFERVSSGMTPKKF